MKWKPFGISDLQVGGRFVSVKTLSFIDKLGVRRRYRVSTVQEPAGKKSTSIPAWGRLAKDSRGRVGALITGAHFSLMRVGQSENLAPYLFVSLDALSKRACQKLLIPLNYEFIEEEDMVLARENREEPYYVASNKSGWFHHPGCRRARRISSKNKIIFHIREEALSAGYRPGKLCKP
ncbi:MAG: Ada metal-binding domain-containing protein [Candidatus Aerophobetes bacterium]|nr:Ada metal-binding domain-containing protein [Candidatus Aerophobetes bacterium]